MYLFSSHNESLCDFRDITDYDVCNLRLLCTGMTGLNPVKSTGIFCIIPSRVKVMMQKNLCLFIVVHNIVYGGPVD